MEDIQHRGIREHNHRLKDPEEPLILHDRVDVFDIDGCRHEVLNSPIDGADGDKCAADQQHVKSALDFAVQNTCAAAIGVEFASQGDKPGHECQLENQGRFEQCLSRIFGTLRAVHVRHTCCAVRCDGLDHNGQGHEGGKHTAGVDWCMVWDVIQNAA